jgi:ADP-ribosylglycohydrolase
MDRIEHYRGALLGLAAGDALGTTLEFRPPGRFEPITDLVGGGPFGLQPGQWTDDTAMASCLAESLIERGGFDAADQKQRYLRWWREGHLSSTGHCFDIGNTVRTALDAFERTGNPFSGSTDPNTAGNGSLMRLAPVPLAFAHDPETAIRLAAESSRTTHGAAEAVDACRYFAGLIVGALTGTTKDELLGPGYCPVPGLWQREPLVTRVAEVSEGSFRDKEPPGIRGTGYVVEALEAALWAFDRSNSFREGALLAVNLGDDADTTGAIFGEIAGAYYGVQGIPASCRERLVRRDILQDYAHLLLSLDDRLRA